MFDWITPNIIEKLLDMPILVVMLINLIIMYKIMVKLTEIILAGKDKEYVIRLTKHKMK